MDNRSFGQFIARLRKEKNWTQAELAEKLHVTDKAVSRWERGIGLPDINTLEPLAEALDITVLELMRSRRLEDPSAGIVPQDVSEGVKLLLALMGKELRGVRRRKLLGAVLAILLTVFCFAGLYRMEYSVEGITDRTLEADIDRYTQPSPQKPEAEVLERVAAGRRLLVLFRRGDGPDSGGLAVLERGIFGGYRFLRVTEWNWPLLHVDTLDAGGKHYLLVAGLHTLPGVAAFALFDNFDGLGTPVYEGPVEEAPFLQCISSDHRWKVSSFGMRYFNAVGEECPQRELLARIPHEENSFSSSAANMEPGLIYVWEGIVLLLGVILTRFFLWDGPVESEGKRPEG